MTNFPKRLMKNRIPLQVSKAKGILRLFPNKRKKIDDRAWRHFEELKKIFLFIMNFIEIGQKTTNLHTSKVE